MKLHRLVALCALLIPLAALAAPVLGGGVARVARAQAAGASDLARLDWLAGAWTGKGLGGDVEMHWTRPTGGSVAGMFRLVQNGKTGFHEFYLIEQGERGVALRFQHFNPGYTAWEKNGPLVLDLVETSTGRAVFQSRDPKQTPARMVYTKHDERNMGVLIESPEALGGPISFELLYERVRE